MSNIKIEIKEDNSEEIMSELDFALERAFERIGLIAEGHAKLNLTMSGAVDTGRLRNSISHATHLNAQAKDYSWTDSTKGRGTKGGSDSTVPRATPEEKSVAIGTNVEYGPYIELGTSKITPRPYLKPAIIDHIEEYKAIIEEEINAYINS